jgi:hypothetical protein
MYNHWAHYPTYSIYIAQQPEEENIVYHQKNGIDNFPYRLVPIDLSLGNIAPRCFFF